MVQTSLKPLPRFTPGVFGVRTRGNTPLENNMKIVEKLSSLVTGVEVASGRAVVR